MAEDEGGFLSRWSRRKAQVRDGGVPVVEHPHPSPLPQAGEGAIPASLEPYGTLAPESPAPPPPTPPPTLDDVALLTRSSDYAPFVARNVAPEVKNAALKKLFTDPHFNVMDGLDTYIGDYNTPDPLPPGMLRQMVQSQLLGLFDDEEQDAAGPALQNPATDAQPALTATPLTDRTAAAPATHEDPDLQLQPDDAAGRPGAAPGAGQDAGRPD